MTIDRRHFLVLTGAIAGSVTTLPAWAQHAPSTLDQVKATKKLRIGVTSAEPWFFKDPMSGTWSGVGISMGKALASDLGVEMVPVETTWANAIAALQANQIDTMFVLDPTPERRLAIDFPASPMFYYALGALVKTDSTVTQWSDLDKPGTRIAVTLGTSIDRIVTGTLKSATISRFANNDEAVAAFAAHRVDVVAQFHPALVVQFARLRLGKVVLPKPVDPVATSAGVRKEEPPAFRDWLSQKFAEYYKEGKPQQFFAAYLKSRGIDPSKVPGLEKEQWS
jgi:polar amino acid transport system substrate-binding protein